MRVYVFLGVVLISLLWEAFKAVTTIRHVTELRSRERLFVTTCEGLMKEIQDEKDGDISTYERLNVVAEAEQLIRDTLDAHASGKWLIRRFMWGMTAHAFLQTVETFLLLLLTANLLQVMKIDGALLSVFAVVSILAGRVFRHVMRNIHGTFHAFSHRLSAGYGRARMRMNGIEIPPGAAMGFVMTVRGSQEQ